MTIILILFGVMAVAVFLYRDWKASSRCRGWGVCDGWCRNRCHAP